MGELGRNGLEASIGAADNVEKRRGSDGTSNSEAERIGINEAWMSSKSS